MHTYMRVFKMECAAVCVQVAHVLLQQRKLSIACSAFKLMQRAPEANVCMAATSIYKHTYKSSFTNDMWHEILAFNNQL